MIDNAGSWYLDVEMVRMVWRMGWLSVTDEGWCERMGSAPKKVIRHVPALLGWLQQILITLSPHSLI